MELNRSLNYGIRRVKGTYKTLTKKDVFTSALKVADNIVTAQQIRMNMVKLLEQDFIQTANL